MLLIDSSAVLLAWASLSWKRLRRDFKNRPEGGVSACYFSESHQVPTPINAFSLPYRTALQQWQWWVRQRAGQLLAWHWRRTWTQWRWASGVCSGPAWRYCWSPCLVPPGSRSRDDWSVPLFWGCIYEGRGERMCVYICAIRQWTQHCVSGIIHVICAAHMHAHLLKYRYVHLH